jgi:hypothetical protein
MDRGSQQLLAFGKVLCPIRTRTLVGWAEEFEQGHKLPAATIANFQEGVMFDIHAQRHTPNGWSLQEHYSCACRVGIRARHRHVTAANQPALVCG